MPERFLLDAPSLVYRAFFAWPQTITAPDGRPVNAVRGFMEMTTTLLVDRRPEEVVAVFDNDWRPAFRVAAYAGYKADRPDEPEALGPQFDILAQVLDAAGIARAEAHGLEADDVIATLVEQKRPDQRAVIVTGDRDLLCLVRDPDVGLLFTVRGVSQVREFDEAEVERDYGIGPRLYIDFATMRGDPSDGLPGVPGIGPKRAAELLRRYGSLEGVLGDLHLLPPKLAATFEQARDYLAAMATVVPLIRDADVELTDRHALDDGALRELAGRYNLGGSATRLGQALRGNR
jgi:5'-3' exonuclease